MVVVAVVLLAIQHAAARLAPLVYKLHDPLARARSMHFLFYSLRRSEAQPLSNLHTHSQRCNKTFRQTLRSACGVACLVKDLLAVAVLRPR